MAINIKNQIFTLHTKNSTYQMKVDEQNMLIHTYYGNRTDDTDCSYLIRMADRGFSGNIPGTDRERVYSLDFLPQEFPVYGDGDYRVDCLKADLGSGVQDGMFFFDSYQIREGKYNIPGLPAFFSSEKSEGETLEIVLKDAVEEVYVHLLYGVFEELDIITRAAVVENRTEGDIQISRIMSACLDLGMGKYDLIHFYGKHAGERQMERNSLPHGITELRSTRGTSSHQHNPFVILADKDTTESTGECYSASFLYSGGFHAQAEVDQFNQTRLVIGIDDYDFSWKLKKGESFSTPEVCLTYSADGFSKLSQTLHQAIVSNLIRSCWKDRVRPILVNNWEATYFDFNEEKILTIAKKAKEAGVELFVLDDGWFGARNDDYRGLGDWYVNLEKLPDGISGLSKKVEELGLKFGLWVELEMVNKDSDLYRAHPDWIISAPNRFESHARHQNVLDFSRKEVVDYIYEMIAKVIRESSISYIKWDMNRYMSEPYSKGSAPCEQGKVMHKYILGVYDLYTRLTTEFPHILFESCASGGARFDPAMLYFAPQTWCSDDTDASERTKIQYGTSYVYPIVSMGSHVSAVPNHQMHRITPIETRANVAYFGTFGYELDLNLLSDAEIETVKKQIAFMKEHRELIQMDGDFYRLLSPFEGNETAWMVVSSDKTQAVAAFYQRLNKVNASWLRLKLDGLDANTKYEVSCDMAPVASYDAKIAEAYGHKTEEDSVKTYQAYGDELMSAGIPIDREELNKKGGDFASLLYTLKKVDE